MDKLFVLPEFGQEICLSEDHFANIRALVEKDGEKKIFIEPTIILKNCLPIAAHCQLIVEKTQAQQVIEKTMIEPAESLQGLKISLSSNQRLLIQLQVPGYQWSELKLLYGRGN